MSNVRESGSGDSLGSKFIIRYSTFDIG